MASSSSSVYSTNIRNRLRLIQISDSGSAKAFQILLEWLTPDWNRSNENFFDYMKRKTDVTMKEFKNALKPSQKTIMKKDPTGSTWDISLLYVLILYGNEFLAHRDDPVWKTAGTATPTLEFLITSIKNARNVVVHCYDPIDNKTFLQKTEEIRKLLTEALTKTEEKCKHVSRSKVRQTIADLDAIINKCRDDPLEPKDLSNYREKLLFQELIKNVETKLREELQTLLSKYKTLSPASFLVELKLPVEDVFTQMILEREGMPNLSIEVETILLNEKDVITDDIILVEGSAGVGKTTLVKKMLSDWINGKKDIKGLDQYPILLHIECRDYVDSLKVLMTLSMPEVSRSFQGEDLLQILRDLKSLIIIDGLDELNPKSSALFRELLSFKYKFDNITLLLTTRPEAVHTYSQFIDFNLVATKHIHLLGIPSGKRDEFVQKYYESIEKVRATQQNIESLLKYLHKTDKRLGFLWASPYNLTLLVILWIMKPTIINSITTSPELNWEIFLLYLEKLEERLRGNSLTQDLLPSILKKKIKIFLYTLCEETLGALANNSINLNEEAFKRLVKTCHDLKIPEEDMLGMFLKRLTSSTTSTPRYSFPHKGTMEFMAARHIFMQLTDTANSLEVHNLATGIENLLSLNDVPVNIIRGILKDAEKILHEGQSRGTVSSSTGTSAKESSLIEDIIRKAESSEEFQLDKYQNLFINLIGLFYLQKEKIDESSKKEALTLLQKTGIRNKEQWIELLNGVKCDQYVASFISKETGVLDDDIEIEDSSLFAYISLLQAMDPHVQVARNLQITIGIEEGSAYINNVLEEINKRNLNVKQLIFEHDFKHPASPIMNPDAVANILQRCKLVKYKGPFHQLLQAAQHIDYLFVSVNNREDYEALLNHLDKHKPTDFLICLSSDMETDSLKSLPQGLGSIGLRCHVCDVKLQNMENSAEILSKIQPEEGFSFVFFPRCFLKEKQHYVFLLETLEKHNIRINRSLYFPESLHPSSEEEQQIEEEAMTKLKCSVSWDLDDW